MPYRIKLSELSRMGTEERDQALTALTDAALRDGAESRAILQARVHQFEVRYEMTSDDMLRAVGDGRMSETADIAEWLFLLGTLNPNGQHQARP